MALTFQDVIMKLHTFWAAQGCVIWQPYNIQVGAGTNNPATLLRVLGPEPWRVAYVEPSIRPDDGRYAENPNRMQMFYQYQVILKPEPGNPQELYLKSLEALGLNPREQDIRFVEDNWESPVLGAWGLGWEVWLNGQEITQFTYFQQAGGLSLEPVSVEITYGIERIVLALQGKDAVWDIEITDGLTYGDVFKQGEIEHCRYYFEIADVDGLRQVYNTYEREYQRALEAGAVLPAYDYVLKCSHLFNVLDTRGAIGVTERAHYFRRMREMTLHVAKAYRHQREELGFPWLSRQTSWLVKVDDEQRTFQTIPEPVQTPQHFLLEIGVEELPPSDLSDVLSQLRTLVPETLGNLRLNYDRVQVYGTPRRLVVMIENLAPFQTQEMVEVKGPPADRAFDAEGNPTKAAEGFAKKYGITPAELTRRQVGDGEYVFANVALESQPTTEVWTVALPELVGSLRFVKSMRWNDSGVSFSRPIRWFVALYGDQVLPFTYADVYSDRITRGIRPYGSQPIEVQNPTDYVTKLAQEGILLDPIERREKIWVDANALAATVNGYIAEDEGLLNEVTNLVERPTAILGSFDEAYLELPREVLVTVMRKHQRYFAVEDKQGNLLPYFVVIHNGDDQYVENVRRGNEHVLIARYADAKFFYESDRSQPLEAYLPRLDTLTFEEHLGSMLAKNNRVRDLIRPFAELLNAADDIIPIAERAAALAKADLATQMVIEFTSLQGVMGRIYALHSGEQPEVADAILQHWLPRSADDALPAGAAGVILALADRLDSLVGLFAVGIMPTASADPFALRRAALGVIQILLDQNLELDLREAIDLVAHYQPVSVSNESKRAVLEFIIGRFRVYLEDSIYPHDVIEAVLAAQGHNPVRSIAGLAELYKWTQQENWEAILDSYARCARIVREQPDYELHPDKFTENAEKELFEAYMRAKQNLHPLMNNVDRFLAVFTTLVPYITGFFEEVMVMAEDQAVRQNRLSLLQHIVALARNYADLSKLQGF
ncbi:MAG: glycine--tRNA ligase subunit alpha/beta [Phototrophicales bacterium]|nr:MAG: glycine--tRNA ligase subunit alpha/beta [Phototrophicales bacterium]